MRHRYTGFAFVLLYGRPVIATALAALTAGCITVEVPTDPNTFEVESARLEHLRQPQGVRLANGHTSPSIAKVQVGSMGQNTVLIDLKQLTETAITMLRRALDKRGITAGSGSEKTVTLLIPQASVIPAPSAPAEVVLEAEFGDGTRTVVAASNRGFAAQRALDGAVLFALNQLLADETFVAYMDK